MEIERKFLVTGNGWRKGGRPSRLRQGYLNAAVNCSVRVRLEDGVGTITVKGRARGLVRPEFEYRIPARDAAAMLDSLCLRPLIEKSRTRVRHAGLTWEVDEFFGDNRGLVVAEIELESATQKVALPPWVGREVTREPKYLNTNLARRPYRTWKKR